MAAAPQQHVENATALAIVVVVNWLLSHLANDWVMPAEVANALQSLVIVLLGTVVHRGGGAPKPADAPPAPAGAPPGASPPSPAPGGPT